MEANIRRMNAANAKNLMGGPKLGKRFLVRLIYFIYELAFMNWYFYKIRKTLIHISIVFYHNYVLILLIINPLFTA